jgi:hypothetical protein
MLGGGLGAVERLGFGGREPQSPFRAWRQRQLVPPGGGAAGHAVLFHFGPRRADIDLQRVEQPRDAGAALAE